MKNLCDVMRNKPLRDESERWIVTDNGRCFCPDCGWGFVREKFCPSCGAQNRFDYPSDDELCEGCTNPCYGKLCPVQNGDRMCVRKAENETFN